MVVDLVGGHGADNAQVVGSPRGVGQEFGEFDTALAVAVEPARAGPDLRVGPDEGQFQISRGRFGQGLPVPSLHRGLGVQKIQLAGAARLEEEDDILRGRSVVGIAHAERIGFGCKQSFVRQQVRERDGSETASGFLEEPSSGAKARSRGRLRVS